MSHRRPHPGGKRPPFTTREIERMVDMKDEGLEIPDIARIMRSNKNTVGELIRRARLSGARPVPIGAEGLR